MKIKDIKRDKSNYKSIKSESDIDEIIAKYMAKKTPSEFEKVKQNIQTPKRDLLEESEAIANLRKYHLALQNVQIPSDVKDFFKKPKQ